MTINATISDKIALGQSASVNKKVVLFALLTMMVLFISFHSTIIPTVLFRQYAWRLTLIFSVLFIAAAWSMFPMRTNKNTWQRVLLFAAVLGGPYVLLLLGESVNALVSGASPLIVRATYIRLFVITLIVVTIVVLAGNGSLLIGLRRLLKPYIAVSVIIATMGLIAGLSVHFKLVDWTSWPPPENLSAKINRKGGASTYAMPLGAGFVLVGSNDINIIGGFRISGLSAEPGAASLFVTPAIFASWFVFSRKRKLRYLLCASLIGFDLLAFSVANILALTLISGLIFVRAIAVDRQWRNAPILVTVVATIGLAVILFSSAFVNSDTVRFIKFKSFNSISSDAVEGVHTTMAKTNSIVGQGIFRDPLNNLGESLEIGLVSAVPFWLQAIVLTCGGIALFMSRKPTFPLGLALIYVVIHSMKDPGHILWWPIYIFIIAVAIVALAVSKDNVRSNENIDYRTREQTYT